MNLPRLSRLAALLTLPLFASGLSACERVGHATPAQEKAEPLVAVRAESVASRDLRRVVGATADLAPAQQIRVVSLVTERIVRFPVENGDEVRKGQIIAEVRPDSLEKALAQLDAQLEALDAQIANQRGELVRGEELFEGKVMSRQALDQLSTGLAANTAQRKALQANREQLAINRCNTVVRAPVDGVIANKSLQVGDLASPQTPLCNLLVVDTVKVELKVGERDSTQVRAGQPVRVTLDAWPERSFEGQVARVLPYFDPATRTATVEVSLPNPVDEALGRRALSPGMFGRAELVLQRREKVAALPQQALLFDEASDEEGARAVFVLDEAGVVHRRPLRVGLRDGSLVEVVAGVSPGERVITVGQQNLQDGQKVRVVSARQGSKVEGA